MSRAQILDDYINSAYDVVKNVYDNLAFLKSAANTPLQISSMSDLVALNTNVKSFVTMLSFHEGLDSGGGDFYWDATRNKADHNGGTIIDPENTADLITWDAAAKTAWFTAGSGLGCWVRVYSGDLNVDWFGAKGDDDGTGSGDDDSAIFDQTSSVAKGGWINVSRAKKYNISTRLGSTDIIRIKGDAPAIFEDSGDVTNNDEDWFPTLVCDGVSLRGVADPTASSTGFAINLRGLENLRIIGVNSAPYAAHFRPTQGFFKNLIFEDFLYHGIWTRGGSLAEFENINFIRCGRTDPVVNAYCHLAANTTLASRNYRRGCSWMAESRNNDTQSASYDAGREASGVYRPTTFSVKNIWSNTNAGTTDLNTSPRDFIFFGHINIISSGYFGGYNGTWIGLSNGSFDNIYHETYSTGGVTIGDGTAFSMYTFNTAISADQTFYTANNRNIRDIAFNAANDFYGYDERQNANKYISRLQLFELILGSYDPDGSSTDWETYAAKGTTANPSLYFNTTAKALLGSVGNNHIPYIGLPIVTTTTVTGSGGTADLAYATLLPALPSPQIGSYEIEIMVGISANVWYWSLWRVSKTSTKQKYVKVCELDEATGAIAVAATGTGTTETLRITNNNASTATYSAKSRVMNVNNFSVTD
jgi:hypothetical protein